MKEQANQMRLCERSLGHAIAALPASVESNLVRQLFNDFLEARRDFVVAVKVEAMAVKDELGFETGD